MLDMRQCNLAKVLMAGSVRLEEAMGMPLRGTRRCISAVQQLAEYALVMKEVKAVSPFPMDGARTCVRHRRCASTRMAAPLYGVCWRAPRPVPPSDLLVEAE